MTLDALIETLQLEPHPEGGWYRETYRAEQTVPTAYGPRAASTAIWFLLAAGTFSAWHRVRSDEIWHHHHGSSVTLHLLDATGYRTQRLGPLSQGAVPRVVVPGGVWQAAEPSGMALCGCTVAPGFDFDDFELADRSNLLDKFPEHAVPIRQFIRDAAQSTPT